MSDDKIIKTKNNSTGGGLATGLAIGAALGAAAVALKDKKNQEKLKQTVKKVKNWADKTQEKFSDKTERIIDEADSDLEDIHKVIKEPEEK